MGVPNTCSIGDTIAVLAGSIEDKVKSLVVVGDDTISTGDTTAVSTDQRQVLSPRRMTLNYMSAWA